MSQSEVTLYWAFVILIKSNPDRVINLRKDRKLGFLEVNEKNNFMSESSSYNWDELEKELKKEFKTKILRYSKSQKSVKE